MVQDAQWTALIVDYDPWERTLASEMLAGHGYGVLTASNGASGLRLVERQPCDVILLDLELPEVSGLDLLRQLKATQATRAIPVVVLGQTPDSLDCPVEGRVPRPLSLALVMRELGRVLNAPPQPAAAPSTGPSGPPRDQPLVLVATADARLAQRIVQHVRRSGAVACAAHSASGCLRVATAVGPDVVLLDPAFPRHLERQLRAHPVSAAADIVRLAATRPVDGPSPSRRSPPGWARFARLPVGWAR